MQPGRRGTDCGQSLHRIGEGEQSQPVANAGRLGVDRDAAQNAGSQRCSNQTRPRLRLHSAALRGLLELLGQRSVCLLRGGEIARLQRGAELVERLTDLTGIAAMMVTV